MILVLSYDTLGLSGIILKCRAKKKPRLSLGVVYKNIRMNTVVNHSISIKNSNAIYWTNIVDKALAVDIPNLGLISDTLYILSMTGVILKHQATSTI